MKRQAVPVRQGPEKPGALVGVVFYLLNSAAAQAGAVYGRPPALSAPAPTLLLLFGLGGWLLLPRLRELIRS